MADASHLPRIARFGVFEADLHTGELRRKGQRLKLQDQPFQVLATLLEQPGELVTREELRSRLWPSDLSVDFEHSLNTAINKIRRVLGDLVEGSRYVETLPRRGYRFIAPVEWVDRSSDVGTPGGVAHVIFQGLSIPLREGENVIGRDPGCEVPVDSTTVSHHHARIRVTETGITIEDLGSRNGTAVLKRKVSGLVPLADGDVIVVGAIPLVFRAVSAQRPTRTASES